MPGGAPLVLLAAGGTGGHLFPAESLAVVSCGYGAAPDQHEQFVADCEELAAQYERIGAQAMAEQYAVGAYRVQFRDKDPRGWAAFKATLAEHSERGAALTMRGVQKLRPSLWDLADGLEARTLAFVETSPPAMTASMAKDLEAGRRLELDWLTGEVVRLGAELGVATPETAAVYEALKPHAMGKGG